VPRPLGLLTFVFTDIEGSTRRWEDDADAMKAALIAHDAALRRAIEAHGGWLFKHTGDGACAAFGSARAAVDAAVDAQRELHLPVRIGIATGEAEERDGDFFGPVLNRVARVMAAGHGGQVLVAASTAALLDGIDLVDLGEHRLRDVPGPVRLFQVRAEGLRTRFPPVRSLAATTGNLPMPATTLFGRDRDLGAVTALLGSHRFVTLTGVGGVGKTRLALEVAGVLGPEFSDGVWLVELAPIGDPAAVPDGVANVLGISPRSGLSVSASITEALAGRRLLLVMDNCEHVLGAAAEVIDGLLAGAPSVKVLATSREGLRLPAEHLWAVPPLDVGRGLASPAVELFAERARAGSPGFSFIGAGDVEAVTDICRRLDGLPLAIELAAARMVSMTPADIRDRLDDRFRLLSGGARSLERHQTLRQAVAWSYDLLSPEEQGVLCRCAVFADGFDLQAATWMCDELRMDDFAVLDVLDSLVRKSLVTVSREGAHTRYRLLETIRQFAEDLIRPAAAAYLRDRHARYFASQAVRQWARWDGPDQGLTLDWVDAEFGTCQGR
jgi:predicted ATPase